MRDYRYVIDIKSRLSTQNSYGEESSYTTLFSSIFAAKEPLIGRELYQAESVNSRVELKFRMHYFEGLDESMRVYCDGIDYEIISVVNVKGLNRELLLYCRKVVGV
jgi:SPP1 family predicted phage head-tail adaptor